MSKKHNPIPKDRNIIKIPLEEAMPDNYLPYAVEVAKERALPDVRDGLKPVHRRILYGAYSLKAFPDRPYLKSARIVGDILGKYHPHGDSSVYDATVILAQEFSTREPLIDGHGNFGSIDGDGAAAMRYTEARLSNIAMEMLKDLDKDTVEMVLNYSGSELEPKVLPSRYPNLLVNGTFGIAVGLATSIPPHNLEEVTEGVISYIDNPRITTKELMNHIKGPDLPTGGILIGVNSLLSAYETGEGKVSYRAKTSIEKLGSGRVAIIITEFPYRRNKARLLQTISEMTGDKRHQKALETITDIRDESDRTGIRAVIEFKKSVDEDMADKVLKYLFKKTDLQCNISFNMVALADGKPETMGLKTIIKHYANHQKDVVTRRTKRELEIAEKRFHIVEGFIKTVGILDEVIACIRSSTSKKDAGVNLIEKFGFTEIQANAILELMLYRLTGLEITTFQKEYNELEKSIKKLKKILSEEKELLKIIKKELREVSEKYKNPRRTQIIKDEKEAKIDIEELIIVEDVMVTISKEGFIKRIPEKNYIRSNTNSEDIEYREGDELKFLLKSNTKDNILLFTNKGNMYQLKGINIKEGKWKERGERIDTLIKSFDSESESIISAMSVDTFRGDRYLQIITNRGNIKKCSMDKFITNYSKLQATKLREGEEVVKVEEVKEQKEFLRVKTKKGLDFTLEIPELEDTSRNNLGLQLFNISDEDSIVYVSYTELMEFAEFTVGITRKGTLKLFAKSNKASKVRANTNSKSDLLMFTSKGNVIKIESFTIQNAIKKELKIENIVSGLQEDEKVVSLFSIKDFTDKLSVYTFTKNGFIKKTSLEEFKGNYFVEQAHKFKSEKDELISVEISENTTPNIVMITKKGMAIKFPSTNINLMGKAALGVIGISLKEDDEVLYGECFIGTIDNKKGSISKDDESNISLRVISKNKKIKEIALKSIKAQNRAGRGTGVIMISLDDEINKIEKI